LSLRLWKEFQSWTPPFEILLAYLGPAETHWFSKWK
jgi:hypothetical protein